VKRRLPPIASSFAVAALAISLLAWPGGPALASASFSDGFESGSMSAWSASSGLSVQGAIVHGGAFAARSGASVAWASKTLPATTNDVEVSMWFRFGSRQHPVWLARARTASNVNLMKVLVNQAGKLAFRNDRTGVTRTSPTVVTNGVWHRLQVHVTIAGAQGHVLVTLDGVSLPSLDRVESLGTVPVGKVEIGNRPAGKSFDLALDDVVVTDLTEQSQTQPPAGVSVDSVAGGDVSLSWSPPTSGPSPTSYRVYRDNALIGSVSATQTDFTDTGASGVTRFLYSVTSVSGAGTSGRSGYAVAQMPGFTGSDAVVYAAGDIVCRPSEPTTPVTCRHRDTADIVASGAGDAVFALGDLQYEIGRPNEYATAYAPTWGRAKSITIPVVGNHEYKCDLPSEGCSYPAQGYFGYFAAAAGDPSSGWHADQVAGWTVLSLNSNCKSGTNWDFTDCNAGSPQYQWVQQQLQNDGSCTVALFHHPRFSSGEEHGSSPWMQALWALLANGGVDLVLSGHDHQYERFAPADAAGASSTSGMRSFVVGTGGRDHASIGPPLALSQARIDDAFGVLKVTLHAGGYDWSFVPAWGDAGTDVGSGTCH
jgi:acid phosphatase type 7